MMFASHSTSTAPLDVSQVMRQVLYALIPGTLLLLWFFGWGLLTNWVLAIGFGLGFEAIMLKWRQRPIQPFLLDYSVIVTAWLLAVALPAYSPWWLMAAAMLFAVVIAKHLYGGLGYNPFNPAMVGYAAMLVSYPLQMTAWPAPLDAGFGQVGFEQTMQLVFGGASPASWDGFSAATALDTVKTDLRTHKPLMDIYAKETFGWLGGKGWEWVNLAWLLGGLWLLRQRIISWHIPAAFLGSLALIAGIFWVIDPAQYASPLFHLFSGAAMLGAFFIATDPVTASTTPRGKLIYAAGIGLFIYIIRTWGGYPDAVAFSVIIMNMVVPLIDHYTQPRVYGT